MEPADHAERKPSPPIEHLGDTRQRAQDAFEIFTRQLLLLHAELDRLVAIPTNSIVALISMWGSRLDER